MSEDSEKRIDQPLTGEEQLTPPPAPTMTDTIQDHEPQGTKEEEPEMRKHLFDAGPVDTNIYANAEVTVNPALVQSLTEGFVSRFLPSLEKAKDTIHQIKSSQTVLLESVQQESAKFTDCRAMADLELMMTRAKQYQNKLIKLKKDMNNLHDRSARLKKRALRLQQQKQKEELTRAHNLEKEFEKERMLTARVAAAPADSS